MGFPEMRLSRMRGNEVFRGMVRENKVELNDLVQPIFVHHGENVKNEIKSMPVEHWREETVQKAGPMAIWDILAQKLEDFIERHE